MKPEQRGCFALKTYQNYLYTWCPNTSVNSTDKSVRSVNNSNKGRFCNATPYSQGEDWRCTYVFDINIDNGKQKKLAYVACDYVM